MGMLCLIAPICSLGVGVLALGAGIQLRGGAVRKSGAADGTGEIIVMGMKGFGPEVGAFDVG